MQEIDQLRQRLKEVSPTTFAFLKGIMLFTFSPGRAEERRVRKCKRVF